MNPYALPFFCVFPLLIVLGLAAILQNPHEKKSRLLCSIYILWSLQAFTAGMLHLATSEAEANFWNKWP